MLARKHLKYVKNYQPGKPIEEVQRQLGLRQVIKLASNESPFGIPRKIKKALIKSLSRINRYPDASSYYLKKEISSFFRVSPSQIILGNGSDELVVLALRAFVEEGQEVIVGYPTFLIYEIQAQACGCRVVRSPLRNFRYDLKDIKKRITKRTKLIFIANPDNPNGTYLNFQEVSRFVESIPKNIIVFLDEAYCDFAPRDFPRSITFVRKGRNVIFTRTFSKAYSLAGLRVGYGIARQELIEAFDKVREPFNVNLLAQVAACEALKGQEYVRKLIQYTNNEKEFLYSQLDEIGLKYVRSATNFILLDLKSASLRVFKGLLRKGIIVRQMSAWGLPNFIRVTIGQHRENVKFINALKEML